MRNSVEVPFNKKYETTPYYPRQKRKLRRLVEALEKRGISPRQTEIEVEGDTNLEVIDSISNQIGDRIGAVHGKRFVPCFGDGGHNVFNNALLANLNGDELEHAVVISDGGTMSNLSNTLKTADPDVAAGVVSGEVPFVVENLRIREAVITTFKSDGEVEQTLTAPWTNSVGLKISGDIINAWESHPRTRHPLVNLMLSTLQVIKDTVRNHVANGTNAPIEGHSITTLQNLGFFKFDSQYTNIEGDEFYHQAFQSKSGWDAMKRIVVFTAIGHHPAVNRWLWSNIPKDQNQVCCSDILKIIAQIEPQPVTNPTFHTDSRYPNIHLDGFPVRMGEMGLEEGGHAEIELRSTDKSIPVARVLN